MFGTVDLDSEAYRVLWIATALVPSLCIDSHGSANRGERNVRPTDIDPSERPIVLIWELTQACDLACKHCRAEAEDLRHPDELTTEEGKQLLADATEFGDEQLVVLSGGDPLYRDDVTELVEYGTDQGLRMTLTPSGTASLTPERIGALAEAGLRRMAVSLDGPDAESHDEFRQEEGSFEQTIAAARTAREKGLPLQVNTTVCAETVDELPAIRDLVADLGESVGDFVGVHPRPTHDRRIHFRQQTDLHESQLPPRSLSQQFYLPFYNLRASNR